MTGDERHELDLGLSLPNDLADAHADAHQPDADPREALSWSWEPDIEALIAAVTGPAHWNRGPVTTPGQSTDPPAPPDSADDPASPESTEDPVSPATLGPMSPATDTAAAADPDPGLDPAEADLADYLDAVAAGRSEAVPLSALAGRVAESVPVGPELAGWLGSGEVGGLEDGVLAGIAASYRRLASWAQAGELAAVAELASRSAAADDRIGVDERGRPAKLPSSACAEVSLALTMSQSSASWWADLAVTLRWRLQATGIALAAGAIDLARARAIADATAFLDDDTAQAVQDKVLPKAGEQTTAQLRAALRRAVIAADPAGADRRREEAEKQAKVMLYPDAEGTASLGGYNLPGIHATAAMARITALARALQATGAGGGIDLLRAHVLLGLLLGTLPYIPPAPDAPPDQPPDDDQPHDEPPPGDESSSDEPSGNEPPGSRLAGDGPPEDGDPEDGDPPRANLPRDGAQRSRTPADSPGRDEQRAREQANDAGTSAEHGDHQQSYSDDRAWARPPPAWPEVPAFLQPGPAAMNHLSPATGAGRLLDVRLPWTALVGESPQPGSLGRLGPITPGQARQLAGLAATDSAVQWQIILTGSRGQAIAATKLARPATNQQASLIKRITVAIGLDDLAGTAGTQPDDLPPALGRILATAQTLADHAAHQAAIDAQADGGCAHTDSTTAYRPSQRLRDYIVARDLTCRFPTCRQPVWRCDLDHTTPFDQGGRTCSCNLGGSCLI